MTKQNKITFVISDEMQRRVENLPRKTKLSEMLRTALNKILDEMKESSKPEWKKMSQSPEP